MSVLAARNEWTGTPGAFVSLEREGKSGSKPDTSIPLRPDLVAQAIKDLVEAYGPQAVPAIRRFTIEEIFQRWLDLE